MLGEQPAGFAGPVQCLSTIRNGIIPNDCRPHSSTLLSARQPLETILTSRSPRVGGEKAVPATLLQRAQEERVPSRGG
jgi:hypothetical protein